MIDIDKNVDKMTNIERNTDGHNQVLPVSYHMIKALANTDFRNLIHSINLFI